MTDVIDLLVNDAAAILAQSREPSVLIWINVGSLRMR